MSLTALFLRYGTQAGAVALACDVNPTLLVRVEARRQPLPLETMKKIASFIGATEGEVAGAAFFVTTASGPRAREPLPALPILGEPIAPTPIRPTQQQP